MIMTPCSNLEPTTHTQVEKDWKGVEMNMKPALV